MAVQKAHTKDVVITPLSLYILYIIIYYIYVYVSLQAKACLRGKQFSKHVANLQIQYGFQTVQILGP